MGNNNNAFSQTDKLCTGDCCKDKRDTTESTGINNIAKFAPDNIPSFLQNQFLQTTSVVPCPDEKIEITSASTQRQKYSAIEQIFFDNVVLPAAYEIHGRVQEKFGMIKLPDDVRKRVSALQTCPKENRRKSLDAHFKFRRPPAHCSSKETSKEIAALIADKQSEPDVGNYPAFFRYSGDAKEVYLTGTFNNWQKLKMARSSQDFIAALDLKEGAFLSVKIKTSPEMKYNSHVI